MWPKNVLGCYNIMLNAYLGCRTSDMMTWYHRQYHVIMLTDMCTYGYMTVIHTLQWHGYILRILLRIRSTLLARGPLGHQISDFTQIFWLGFFLRLVSTSPTASEGRGTSLTYMCSVWKLDRKYHKMSQNFPKVWHFLSILHKVRATADAARRPPSRSKYYYW